MTRKKHQKSKDDVNLRLDSVQQSLSLLGSRMDSVYKNIFTGMGTSRDITESTEIKPFEPYSPLTLEHHYSMDPIKRKIIDTIVKYIFKDGFIIECDDPEYNKEFTELFVQKYQVWSKCKRLATQGYVYGDAFMWLDVEGAKKIVTNYENSNSNIRYVEDIPLVTKDVKAIRKLYVLSRYFFAPNPTEMDFDFNPLSYYLITTPIVGNYNMNAAEGQEAYLKQIEDIKRLPNMIAKSIHHSRLLRYSGIQLMPFNFRTNMHFHDSYIRKIENASRNYNTAMDNMATMLSRIPLPIHKIMGLAQSLTNPTQRQALAAALDAKNRARSVHNVSAIDIQEEFEYYTPTLAGIAELTRQAQERLCLDTDIPHDVLFGEGSIGQTTGRTEKTTFQSFIDAERQEKVEPIIRYFMDLFQYTDGLKMPKEFSVSFEHHESLTKLEESQVFSQLASGVASLESFGYDCADFVESRYPEITKSEEMLAEMSLEEELSGDNDEEKKDKKDNKGK